MQRTRRKEEGSTAMLSDLPGDVDVEEQRNPDLTTSPSDTQATPATNPALTENEQAEEVQMQAPEVENANKQEETDQLLETEPFDSSSTASLLPPPQPETAYPTMPTISSLPGTTASPIRVPFGSGKGELIDLPGIARSNLETFTKPENTQDLVMKSRITPEQYTIKPGQSLLLGGLIRITPTTPDLVFLAYPFVPLHAHVTSTEKAVAIQAGERSLDSSRPELSIANSNACSRMQSAGKYKLEWDVTKKRAGPLTSPVAAKLKADRLPFVVYSADVLVEG
ncbi:Mitochondrial ribosome small subunit biogenesis protein [Taxawa tesnikishii (nom. ined.)]|nr:Mitochondrial ribosome small subunit biogenesis protein [Dothideales sp. JES 119]